MKLRTKLMNIAKAVADQAERSPEFAAHLADILRMDATHKPRNESAARARPKNRRASAVLDPVAVIREGEGVLRERLISLSLEQLRDIVADHGMDPGKLVMKWKDTSRVIDRIVEVSGSRATKGDAFRTE